jgi:hypothetical protein
VIHFGQEGMISYEHMGRPPLRAVAVRLFFSCADDLIGEACQNPPLLFRHYRRDAQLDPDHPAFIGF